MDEIVFRGKRKDEWGWAHGSPLFGFGKAYICPEVFAMYYFDGALCLGNCVEVDPETVGQFTGLYDSTTWEELTPEEQDYFLHQPDGWENMEDVWHGKPIYAGDIISYISPDDLHCVGVVRFGNYGNLSLDTGFFVEWFKPFAASWMRQDIRFWTIARETRIIGNIHDNPELLEV